ncbi:MAG: hypothetical protein IJ761_02625 [Bacteroidales bacterium]|nr:hypothetical protein [Bacteroidales bacterium]
MKKTLLLLVACAGFVATVSAQIHLDLNVGISLPTVQRTGLYTTRLMNADGIVSYPGVGVQTGVFLSADLLWQIPSSERFYLMLNTGLMAAGQDVAIEQFANSYRFVAPSLNVADYVFVPGILGVKYVWQVSDVVGLFYDLGAGVNYRYVKYGILEDNPEDDTYFRDRGYTFAFQAGTGFELAEKLTLGMRLNTFGNGRKPTSVYNEYDDAYEVVPTDPGTFVQHFISLYMGYRF